MFLSSNRKFANHLQVEKLLGVFWVILWNRKTEFKSHRSKINISSSFILENISAKKVFELTEIDSLLIFSAIIGVVINVFENEDYRYRCLQSKFLHMS